MIRKQRSGQEERRYVVLGRFVLIFHIYEIGDTMGIDENIDDK